jgi:L-alanine-DL-glutamate epimerase-like enolase superfamily enzyme
MTAIARLDTRSVRVPLRSARGGSGATQFDVVLVTLTDTDGTTGTGFTFALAGGMEAAAAIIDVTYRPEVLHTELLDWGRTWERLWSIAHSLGRGVALSALSALDIAVWDLRARAAGLPLYRLLGAVRDAIPAYGSGRATNLMNVDELIEGTLSYVAEGFRAVKLRAGGRPLEEEVARMTAVREAVGPEIRLMVDCNERLEFAGALWFGRHLEELGFYWYEEPLRSDDVAGHTRLAAKLRVAIAGGEHLQGRYEFVDYLRHDAASVLQPDAPLVGGITEFLRIATVADAFGANISPHFLPELHIHLGLAAQACIYIEHFPLLDELLAETLAVTDGQMRAPDRPGHGILWDADAIERYKLPTPAHNR